MAKQSRPFAKTESIELLKEFNPLPKLVVFDLGKYQTKLTF